jgi:hypothetical protein
MNAETTPTPEQVEARLAEVFALNRLCASLRDAGRVLRPLGQAVSAASMSEGVEGPRTCRQAIEPSISGQSLACPGVPRR